MKIPVFPFFPAIDTRLGTGYISENRMRNILIDRMLGGGKSWVIACQVNGERWD